MSSIPIACSSAPSRKHAAECEGHCRDENLRERMRRERKREREKGADRWREGSPVVAAGAANPPWQKAGGQNLGSAPRRSKRGWWSGWASLVAPGGVTRKPGAIGHPLGGIGESAPSGSRGGGRRPPPEKKEKWRKEKMGKVPELVRAGVVVWTAHASLIPGTGTECI